MMNSQVVENFVEMERRGRVFDGKYSALGVRESGDSDSLAIVNVIDFYCVPFAVLPFSSFVIIVRALRAFVSWPPGDGT